MDICSDNEGQRATPPIEMLRTGQYVIPTINDVDYLTKPPLLYWMVASVYKITGRVSEWTARIPTALCGVLLVLCVYWLWRREAGEGAVQWSAVVLLTCPYFLERSRWTEIDVPFSLAVFLSIVSLREACLAQRLPRTAGFVLSAGAAFGSALLLKGPPAFLFLAAAWIGLLVVEGQDTRSALKTGGLGTLAAGFLAALFWMLPVRFPIALVVFAAVWAYGALRYAGASLRRRASASLAGALVVGILIALPWCLAVLEKRGAAHVWALLHTEALERAYAASEINSGSPAFYLIGIVGMAAPWGLLFPMQSAPLAWTRRGSLYRFCVMSGWLSIGLFSLIAAKEYEYILPALPFLAVATGFILAEAQSGRLPPGWESGWVRGWERVMAPVIAGVVPIGAGYFMYAAREATLWFTMAAFVGACAAVAAWGLRKPDRRLAALTAMTLSAILIVLVGRGYVLSTPQRSPKVLGLACRDLVEQGHTLETARRLGSTQPFPYPALAFYLQHPIGFEDSPEEVIQKLTGPAPYFFLMRQKSLNDVVFQAHDETFRILLGPFDRKDLVVIGNAPLPESPALAEAARLNP